MQAKRQAAAPNSRSKPSANMKLTTHVVSIAVIVSFFYVCTLAGGKTILQAALFFSLLLAASVWDIQKREIPDRICLTLALTALIAFEPQNLLGVFAALPLFIAAVTVDGMGGGDVKLTAAAGLTLGLMPGMVGVVLGLTAMLLFYAVGKIIRTAQGAVMSKSLPLAPFLLLGFIAAYLLKVGGITL